MNTLTTFPSDVLLLIGSYTRKNKLSIHNLSKTCRRFYSLFHTNITTTHLKNDILIKLMNNVIKLRTFIPLSELKDCPSLTRIKSLDYQNDCITDLIAYNVLNPNLTKLNLSVATPDAVSKIGVFKNLKKICLCIPTAHKLTEFNFAPLFSIESIQIVMKESPEPAEIEFLMSLEDSVLKHFKKTIVEFDCKLLLSHLLYKNLIKKEHINRLLDLDFPLDYNYICWNFRRILLIQDDHLTLKFINKIDFFKICERKIIWNIIYCIDINFLGFVEKFLYELKDPKKRLCILEFILAKFDAAIMEEILSIDPLSLPPLFQHMDAEFLETAIRNQEKLKLLFRQVLNLTPFLKHKDFLIFFSQLQEIPKITDENGNTLYHYAIHYPKILGCFLGKEKDPEFILQKNHAGKTALDLAFEYGMRPIALLEYLHRRGLDYLHHITKKQKR